VKVFLNNNMATIKELAKKSPKHCWSKVNAVWHYLGLYTAKPLLKTKITPNQITIFWILLEIFAAVLMLGSYWHRVVGIITFNFIVTLLDFTDGNIARIKNQGSNLGIYLEHLGIYFGMPLIFLFLGINIHLKTGSLIPLYVGSFCCIIMLYEKIININPSWYKPDKWAQIKEVYLSGSLSKGGIITHLSEIFRRGQPFNLLFFGIILDYPLTTMIIYAFVATASLFYKFKTQYSAAKKLDVKTKKNKEVFRLNKENPELLKKSIVEHYDVYGKIYDKKNTSVKQQMIDKLAFSKIKQYAQGKDVLEVGCGTGIWMEKLQQEVKSIWGIDISKGMLREAKIKNLNVTIGDADLLPFPDKSFEFVFSYRVLPHVPDINKAIKEIKRVLKDEGKAIIMFYNKNSLKYFSTKKKMNKRVFTKFYTKKEILKFDDNIKFIAGTKIFPYPKRLLKINAINKVYILLERFFEKTPINWFGGNVLFELKK